MKRTSRPAPPDGKEKRPRSPLPSRDDIRRLIETAPGPVGKRDVIRHFNLGPEHANAIRGLLKSLSGAGLTSPSPRRPDQPRDTDRSVMVVQITGSNTDGEALARAVDWTGDGPPPYIIMEPEPKGRPALAPGEKLVARLTAIGPNRFAARTIKRLAEAPARIIGVYQPGTAGYGRLVPTDRRAKAEWAIPPGEHNGALAGEIVLATPLPSSGYGLKPARIIERLGAMGDARSVSLIVIHTHDIPTEFTQEALAAAEAATATPLKGRTDLRHLPLLTIDGDDARDFDDAVFAEATPTGFRLVVAIADVAHYVRPASPLDRAARTRGNSCYFPDRVVPMLPEALSNGWCSLRPNEDRGCLYVDIAINAAGQKTAHSFGRALMRSAARLTYEQVQSAHDRNDDLSLPIPTLYAAFQTLLAARTARGTLDLDLPERKVVLDDAGKVASVAPRPRLDSHRLIEEFMVLANVCAAEELERRHQPCVYRIHAPPSEEKLETLRTFLHSFAITLPPGGQIHPRDLDRVLKKVAGTEHALLVNEVILRSQMQAAYDVDNIGHFGLALPRYAHFTSPIRRYADLLVHRALITGLKLGPDGLDAAAPLAETCEHITATERRATLAERDAIDRYLAAFMTDKVGTIFDARITGVTRFGLFVTIAENGASGLVPISTLPEDFYIHDEAHQTLTGRRNGLTFRLAQQVEARLSEASPITGGLIFHLLQSAPRRQSRRR